MKKTAKILLALCACMLIGGNAAMAQNRMEESTATVKALYGTENPCTVNGAPELSDIMQKLIYSDVKNQVKMPLKAGTFNAGSFNSQ